ncbi:MAG: 2-dehydropantoate 2-reductase [Candidatus Omnitrophota bacterium]
MKIAVVGPGAMGCLVAALVANKTKEEVWLVDRDDDRAKKIRSRGIIVEGISGSMKVPVRTTADPREAGESDLVIICTKSYSTEEACKKIVSMVGARTSIMTLQNGVGNVQTISENFDPDKVVCGVTSHGATLLDVGHVRHAGKGDTIIGRPDGRVTLPLRTIQTMLTRAGFATKVSKNIESIVWSKLIINVGINALTAVTMLHNGMLIEYPGTKEIMRDAVSEAVKIAKRKKRKLIYDDPIQKVESVGKATATNISSMLQDVLKKKKTEIDYINGAIVRHGKSLSIPTPVNSVLTNLVKTIESSYDKRL